MIYKDRFRGTKPMANQEHLEILQQGAEAWNQWRWNNFDITPNLGYATLSKANLSAATLSKANLFNADLSGADLSYANLSRADLSYANLSNANLSRADLSNVDFSQANLSEAYLSGATLSKAKLSWAILKDTNLSNADLSGADLSKANLSNAYLSGADLSGADLSGAKLSGASLREANLHKANLHKANLHKANLSQITLSYATLSYTTLCEANLCEANLCEANLRKANLSYANLSYANLRKANLSYANLRKANLSYAILRDATLRDATLRDATLRDADLKTARLINATLNRANITGVTLWETQRANWSIKEVSCEYIYWDKEAKEKTEYAPDEFERLFGEQPKIHLFYKGGINPLEVATLPALIQHLEDAHPGCKLSLLTIKSDSGGVVVELAVEEDEPSPEQLQKFLPSDQTQEKIAEKDIEKWETTIEQLQLDAQQAAQRLGQVIKENEKLQIQVKTLQWVFTEMLNKGTGDTYNISGQIGAIGAGSRAEHNTLTSTPAKKTEDE
jgi:uncharacterized protein YjbI with pentapeptide repeats